MVESNGRGNKAMIIPLDFTVNLRAGRSRQGPRFSIRMIIWIFCSDTETGAVTPLGRGAETLTALKILLLSLIADVKQS